MLERERGKGWVELEPNRPRQSRLPEQAIHRDTIVIADIFQQLSSSPSRAQTEYRPIVINQGAQPGNTCGCSTPILPYESAFPVPYRCISCC